MGSRRPRGHEFLTATLDDYRRMVLSSRAACATRSRAIAANNERGNGRDKPERARPEKRTPLKQRIAEAEAEIERINGIIAKIDTALALPGSVHARPRNRPPSSARPAPAPRALTAGRGSLAGGPMFAILRGATG